MEATFQELYPAVYRTKMMEVAKKLWLNNGDKNYKKQKSETMTELAGPPHSTYVHRI